MNRHVTSRIAAVVLLGIIGGFLIHHDEAKWGARGRDAFMAHEMGLRLARLNVTVGVAKIDGISKSDAILKPVIAAARAALLTHSTIGAQPTVSLVAAGAAF